MRVLPGLIAAVLLASSVNAADYRLLRIDDLTLKWGAPWLGSGATVTYGLATGHAAFPDAINCRALAPVADLASAASIAQPRLDATIAEAFAWWGAVADIAFQPAPAGEAPDILIGAQVAPARIAFANVWWDAGAAQRGVAPLTRATICLNPLVAWSLGPAEGAIDLRHVLAHEIGHAIGLDHPGPTGALMGYRSQPPAAGVMHGDIAGAVTLYGRSSDRRGAFPS